jgi:hypothetical protein
MDAITSSLLNEFRKSHAVESLPESDAFEHFANFSVLFSELADTFDLDDVHVGVDSTVGIDGLAIVVNGALVTSEQDADSLVEANKYLDAQFICIQSKSSPKFELGEISNFFYAVTDFFSAKPKLLTSLDMKDLARLKAHIYAKHSGRMTKGNPTLSLYYVTTGKWTDDHILKTRITSAIAELEDTQLFEKVIFTPVDARKLQKLYRDTQSKTKAKFNFTRRVTLPVSLEGIKEAHFGVIPAAQFLQLIQDDSGAIRKHLFYDNVRDFQDYNEVNKEIRTTIQSADKPLFPLLNNGVTVIASIVRPIGDEFHIEDFQIVNGCQTSHVVFYERAHLTDNVHIPIKLIVTDDDNIVNKVIKAVNFQTEVKPDQLYALSEFQKILEQYYAAMPDEVKLYYERRSKQFATAAQVEKVRIVTIQQQIRAYSSMFLSEAHRGHYPRSMGAAVGKSLFGRDHNPEPYHVSAFAQYRLEYFFRNRSLDKKFKPARYHLLMAARQILLPRAVPSPSSNDVKKFAAELLMHLRDDTKALQAFKQAARIIEQAAGRKAIDRKLTKTVPFTKLVQTALDKSYPVREKPRKLDR